MTTLITTIGTGKYQETTYYFSDELRYRTCYVAEAISRMKNIDKVIFLLTEEARREHWDKLQQCFREIETPIGIQDRHIPDGRTEAEIWHIFDVLVDTVPSNSQVIFDITHAFRSIPMLILLGAALLRTAKNVKIEGLYYGFYRQNQPETPILDLTPALCLLDWLTATDKFISTGSAIELGTLLQTVHQDFYRTQKPGKHEPRPLTLQNFGSTIQDVSRSIELIRPVDLLTEDLPRLTRQSTARLAEETGMFAKPFGLILEQVQQSYAPLALSTKNSDASEQIYKQFLLLQWYVEKRFTVHALLLAREWVVSALCLLSGWDDYLEREYREGIEKQLGAMIGYGDSPNPEQPIATYVSDAKKLADFWQNLTGCRNDIAHPQMRRTPLNSQALEKFALNQLLPTLEFLFPTLVVHPNSCSS